MSLQKTELNLIKEIVETECNENVKVVVAEKPGWLLLKTVERMKTIGCIRLNKNSFITLYIDTKEGILLEDELKKLTSFKNVDIKSRPTGNFVQNKFKLFTEDQIDLVIEAVNYVFEKDIVKTGKRVRNVSAESRSIA
jgi:hypothetical protein